MINISDLKLIFLMKKIKKEKNFIKHLIENSNYIHSECIIEPRLNKNDISFWWISLPLKKENDSFFNSSNWDLPKSKVIKIKEMLKQLFLYSDTILFYSYNKENDYLKKHLNNITDFLPPWIVFPLYDQYTIHWRMGQGEGYMDAYINFIRSLTEEEFDLYNSTYKEPCYMKNADFTINILNNKIRNDK